MTYAIRNAHAQNKEFFFFGGTFDSPASTIIRAIIFLVNPAGARVEALGNNAAGGAVSVSSCNLHEVYIVHNVSHVFGVFCSCMHSLAI